MACGFKGGYRHAFPLAFAAVVVCLSLGACICSCRTVPEPVTETVYEYIEVDRQHIEQLEQSVRRSDELVTELVSVAEELQRDIENTRAVTDLASHTAGDIRRAWEAVEEFVGRLIETERRLEEALRYYISSSGGEDGGAEQGGIDGIGVSE